MNREGHRVVGVAADASFTLIKYIIKKNDDPNLEFPWDELLISTMIGCSLASLPDWIEPAKDPNHRKFFHSLTAAGFIMHWAFGKHIENIDENIKKIIQPIAVSYLVHLAADSQTPLSLPFIHPKIV
jgi:membrane-bound metal-dependent hydrolase YbcI (DUF457 family)